MDNAVALAAIGLATTSIAGVIWIAKYFAKELTKDLKAHTLAAEQQRQASLQAANASIALEKTVSRVGDQAELSAANSEENLKFLKKLNGKLENAIIQKVAEQHVEHQTIEHST